MQTIRCTLWRRCFTARWSAQCSSPRWSIRWCVLTLWSLACSTPVLQGALPPHSWDHVPTYAFCGPANRPFNATELAWLAGRPLPHRGEGGARLLHRPHWLALGYATESAPPMAPGHSEAKQINVARQVRSSVPDMYVLPGTAWDMIFKPVGNSSHAMFDVDDEFNARPELQLHCGGSVALRPDGTRVHDWANPAARALWASTFARFKASGSLRGAFLDGIGRCRHSEQPAPRGSAANGCGASAGYDINSNPNCSAAQRRAWSAGEALAIAAVRDAVGRNNLTICNGHDTIYEGGAQSTVNTSSDDVGVATANPWPPTPRWCSGNFQEEWQGFVVDVLLLLRAASIPGYVSAVRSIGYAVDVHGDQDHNFNRTLAAFLIAAQNHSYYLHYLGYDCGNSGQMDYHREYLLPLGSPDANATGTCKAPDGPCELRRTFGHGNVSVFYKGNSTQGLEQTCIRWGDGTVTEYRGGCYASRRQSSAPARVQKEETVCHTTIDNRQPRTLVGNRAAILNGHDGSINYWNNTYIYHALAYDNCTEQKEGCASHCVTCCGYTAHHRVAVYTSSDLAQDSWSLAAHDVIPLPVGPAPAGRGVIFRPKAVYRHGMWHLFWANNLATASSISPFGPFVFNGHVNMTAGQAGDFDIFVDDDVGATTYAAYTHFGVIRVEELHADLKTSTGRFVSTLGRHNRQCEAPAMFKRRGVYYLLFGRFCCFCQEGSGVFVHTASSPLGPWHEQGEIGCTNGTEQHHSPLTIGCWGMDHKRSITQSQLSYVIHTNADEYIYAGDRWQQAPDHLKAHDPQVWLPLEFDGERILPLRMVDTFVLRCL